MKKNKGLTLIEMLIAISLVGMVLAVTYNILIFEIKTFNMSDTKSSAQRDVRYISDFLGNELRFAKEVDILPDKSSITDNNYKYIYSEGGQIYFKNYGDKPGTPINIEDRSPDYTLNFTSENDDDKILKFDIASANENYAVNSSINIINTKLTKNTGQVIRYKLPDFNKVLSFIDKNNQFWYDLVKSSLEGTLNTVSGYKSDQQVDGGLLSLNVKSTTASSGGSSLYTKLDEDAFKNVKGDIKSYSIIVDAKVNGGKGGYGVLINGIVDNNNKDNGYMFQFDPGAYGFVIRQISNASHNSSLDLGATNTTVSNTNDLPFGMLYHAVYSPKHIENTNFKWNKNTWNQDSDWFKRYKTELKLQTLGDGSLIIRAVVIDEAGNRSNEMWFGDFGSINLNGTVFNGKALGNFKNNGGDVFGLRVWDNDGGKAKTDFYEIKIGDANPAPRKAEVKTTDKKIILRFDDKLAGDASYISAAKSNVTVRDSEGNDYDIADMQKTGNDYNLELSIIPRKDGTTELPIPTDLTIEYNKNENNGLKDSFGNSVDKFKFVNNVYKQ